jgi:nitrite reductase (NADH) small subunit
MAWTSLCAIDELKEGQGKYVEISGFELAVFLSGGKVYVMENMCPHAGGNLATGFIDDGCAVCPWHYWSFRLENGELRDSPGVKVRTYATRMYSQENKSDLVQADLPIF